MMRRRLPVFGTSGEYSELVPGGLAGAAEQVPVPLKLVRGGPTDAAEQARLSGAVELEQLKLVVRARLADGAREPA